MKVKTLGKSPARSRAFLRTFANQARFSFHSELNGEREIEILARLSPVNSDAPPVRIGAFNRTCAKKRTNVSARNRRGDVCTHTHTLLEIIEGDRELNGQSSVGRFRESRTRNSKWL